MTATLTEIQPTAESDDSIAMPQAPEGGYDGLKIEDGSYTIYRDPSDNMEPVGDKPAASLDRTTERHEVGHGVADIPALETTHFSGPAVTRETVMAHLHPRGEVVDLPTYVPEAIAGKSLREVGIQDPSWGDNPTAKRQ